MTPGAKMARTVVSALEFIDLLKRLDTHYPSDALIRVVLDNHSAHISKETMAYWPPARDALNIFIRPNMALGSI